MYICTYSFVCDELVREELNWRMVVARCDQGVLCMCMHKLGEWRVDKALCNGSVDWTTVVILGGMHIPFRRTNPSTTGVTLVVEWPMSMTNAEPFPAAKLNVGSTGHRRFQNRRKESDGRV